MRDTAILSAFDRLRIHVRNHQHLFGCPVDNNRGDQPVRSKLGIECQGGVAWFRRSSINGQGESFDEMSL